MSFLPNYRNMKRVNNYPTIEEIVAKGILDYEDYNMTPKDMLKLADEMEFGTYKGLINLSMSWEETINKLRKDAYKKLYNY